MTDTLVLGSTGHIGAHIVRALVKEGHKARAAYRNPKHLFVLEGLPVEKVCVDLESLEGLKKALQGAQWIFHAAGYYPSVYEDPKVAVNRGVLSTRRALEEISHAHPARVVFTSSAATIRRVPGRPATEADAESWPLSQERPLYPTVKIAMEHEALQAAAGGLPLVVVNPSLCLGEYDARVFSGRSLFPYAKYRIPFYIPYEFNAIYTGDVGLGHLRAAERGRVGDRYLLSAHNVTLKEFAAEVARAAGVKPPRFQLPYSLALASSYVLDGIGRITGKKSLATPETVRATRMGQLMDGSKAQREFGIRVTPLAEAIEKALGWFRQHGYLS